MSFGFSPSDIVTLIAITQKAYDGWRSAGKRFEDISDTLNSFEILLGHVNHRFNELDKSVRGRRRDLERVLRGCKAAVTELADIARRHQRLRNWDKLKLGLKDIISPKERLVRHMGLLTPFLLITEMESIGKDIRCIPSTFDRIPNMIQGAITVAFGNMLDSRANDVRSTRSSILTTYGDDDKSAYKELRRNLRSLGIRDSDVREHRRELIRLMRSVLSPDDFTHQELGFHEDPASSLYTESSKARGIDPPAFPIESSRLGVRTATVESDDELDEVDCGIENGPVDGPLLEDNHVIEGSPSVSVPSTDEQSETESGAQLNMLEPNKRNLSSAPRTTNESEGSVHVSAFTATEPSDGPCSGEISADVPTSSFDEERSEDLPDEVNQDAPLETREAPVHTSEHDDDCERETDPDESLQYDSGEESYDESSECDSAAGSIDEQENTTENPPELGVINPQPDQAGPEDTISQQPSKLDVTDVSLDPLSGSTGASAHAPTDMRTSPAPTSDELSGDGQSKGDDKTPATGMSQQMESSSDADGEGESDSESQPEPGPAKSNQGALRASRASKAVEEPLGEFDRSLGSGTKEDPESDASSEVGPELEHKSMHAIVADPNALESTSPARSRVEGENVSDPRDSISTDGENSMALVQLKDPSGPNAELSPTHHKLQSNSLPSPSYQAYSDYQRALAEAHDHHQSLWSPSGGVFNAQETSRLSTLRAVSTDDDKHSQREEHRVPPYVPNLPRITYTPLDPYTEHRLTVQLSLADGWPDGLEKVMENRHMDGAALPSFRCHFHRNKHPLKGQQTYDHGFPSAANFALPPYLNLGNLRGKCNCRVLKWTPEQEDCSPGFLDYLRTLVGSAITPVNVETGKDEETMMSEYDENKSYDSGESDERSRSCSTTTTYRSLGSSPSFDGAVWGSASEDEEPSTSKRRVRRSRPHPPAFPPHTDSDTEEYNAPAFHARQRRYRSPAPSDAWSSTADRGTEDMPKAALNHADLLPQRRAEAAGIRRPRTGFTPHPTHDQAHLSAPPRRSPDFQGPAPGYYGGNPFSHLNHPSVNTFSPYYPQGLPVPPAPIMKPSVPVPPASQPQERAFNIPGHPCGHQYQTGGYPFHDQSVRQDRRHDRPPFQPSTDHRQPRYHPHRPADNRARNEHRAPSDPQDIFAEFMRGFPPSDAPDPFEHPKPRIKIVEVPLRVSLEHIFNGIPSKIKVSRKALDPDTGRQTVEERVLTIPIKRGLRAGSKIRYPGMGDVTADEIQDLHLILREKPHPLFVRDGDDLRHTLDITLDEAKDGWRRIVRSIEGKAVLVSSNGPTGSGFKERFPGLGMPNPRNPKARGELIFGVRIVV